MQELQLCVMNKINLLRLLATIEIVPGSVPRVPGSKTFNESSRRYSPPLEAFIGTDLPGGEGHKSPHLTLKS